MCAKVLATNHSIPSRASALFSNIHHIHTINTRIDKHYRCSHQSFAQSQCLRDLTGSKIAICPPIVRFDNKSGAANTYPTSSIMSLFLCSDIPNNVHNDLHYKLVGAQLNDWNAYLAEIGIFVWYLHSFRSPTRRDIELLIIILSCVPQGINICSMSSQTKSLRKTHSADTCYSFRFTA